MHAEKECQYFARGREVIGKASGGLLTSVLKAYRQDIDAARALLETAADKDDPREWLSAACRHNRINPPKPVASGIWTKRKVETNGRRYFRGDSPQWLAWDAYLKAQGKPGAIRDYDGGWWFPSEFPPGLEPVPFA
jgi:hypothetical protein